MDRVATWRDEHANFTKLLGLLEAEIERFHWAEKPDYRLMLDVMSYMTQYPDRFHHPVEELAFARAAERVPALRAKVEVLSKEHRRLLANAEALIERLEGVLSEAVVSRRHVEILGRNYISYLRNHMRREEADIYPVVQKVLEAADWAKIDREIERRSDPLFGPAVRERFRSLRREIDAESLAKG
jgi:hemerythrin-like domain-containing protein